MSQRRFDFLKHAPAIAVTSMRWAIVVLSIVAVACKQPSQKPDTKPQPAPMTVTATDAGQIEPTHPETTPPPTEADILLQSNPYLYDKVHPHVRVPEPKAPYEDDGACPFECCTYREWTVDADTAVYESRSPGAAVAFRLKKGDRVAGVTGIVVTSRIGRAVARQTVTRSLDFKKGDTIPVLHEGAEGYWLVWHDGYMTGEQLDEDCKSRPAECELELVQKPVAVWWVQIRDAAGRVGWSRQPEHFGDKDACG